MSDKTDMPEPKPQTMWGWYNFGMLHGVSHRRKDAIRDVEAHVMEPWSKAKAYMQIRKVTVMPSERTKRTGGNS